MRPITAYLLTTVSLCLVVFLAVGCAHRAQGPSAEQRIAQCYADLAEGRHISYEGRRDLEACDRFASNLRMAEAQQGQINAQWAAQQQAQWNGAITQWYLLNQYQHSQPLPYNPYLYNPNAGRSRY